MKSVVLLAAGVLCVCVSACGSRGEETAYASSPECRPDGSMPEIKACAGDDLGREQARMHRYFAAAMTRARESDADSVKYGHRTRQAAWLSDAQRDWEVYAESRCGVWRPDGSGGTMGGLFYTSCLTQATRQRTHDIWSDYLTFMSETTPPVLPEPLRTVAEDEVAAEPTPPTAPKTHPGMTG
ncbi:MAG: DUF1311 domain-containing protein [Brevundimonas sp.]|nr:MAG: DUF1311 domain-containing protein [Brevundimonas sp.]